MKEIIFLSTDEDCEFEGLSVDSGLSEEEQLQQFEADLLLLHQRCKKKHQHQKFIPLKDLRLEHLPESGRCWGNLQFIIMNGLRIVRLIVKTSKDRPKKYGRGIQTASGFVDTLRSKVPVEGFTPGTTFWVNTAAHVVWNDEEARNTKIQFFFDDDCDKSGVRAGKGVRVRRVFEKM